MKKDRVSWRIAFIIWWAQFWRLGLVIGLFVLAIFFIAYAMAAEPQTDAVVGAEFIGRCVGYVVGAVVYTWAIREALVNRYKSFEITITNRANPAESVLSSRGRVKWRIALAVWWAQFWRYYLFVGIIGLILGAAWVFVATLHLPIQFAMLAPVAVVSMVALFFFVFVCAVRESLVDDYKSFTLKITDRKLAAD